MLTLLLERSGAEVVAVGSGRAALEEIQKHKPDVLVCDIGMPEMNGYEFLRRVRDLKPEIASVPAIACTAFARNEDVERAFAAGFQAHIAKPIDPKNFVQTVADVAAGRKNAPIDPGNFGRT
jgi:CheY-like chemotaxis protein